MDEMKNEIVENEQPSIETPEVELNNTVLAENDVATLTEGVMHAKDMKKVSKKQTVVKVLVQVGLYSFLTIMAFIVIFPFLWMLATSLKHNGLTGENGIIINPFSEYYDLSDLILFPTSSQTPYKTRDFANFLEIFTDVTIAGSEATLGGSFLYTLIIGISSTVMSLIITVLSAFALSRLEFKGKNVLFACLLATMMIPGELFTVTNFQTVVNFGWNEQSHGIVGWFNSFFNLTIPFLVSVFYIYLLKQNFMQIPNELYLAAKVDGTTDFKYLWKVMIPLALPTLISITILKMMGAWNTYMWPKLTTTNPQYYLITIGLKEAFTSEGNLQPDIPQQMAAITMVSLPLFMVFIFLRKYIMKGVSRSGIKG